MDTTNNIQVGTWWETKEGIHPDVMIVAVGFTEVVYDFLGTLQRCPVDDFLRDNQPATKWTIEREGNELVKRL